MLLAVLGLHAINDEAVVVNGKVEVRPIMYLALTYDHRLLDGREAVTFLVKVRPRARCPAPNQPLTDTSVDADQAVYRRPSPHAARLKGANAHRMSTFLSLQQHSIGVMRQCKIKAFKMLHNTILRQHGSCIEELKLILGRI